MGYDPVWPAISGGGGGGVASSRQTSLLILDTFPF